MKKILALALVLSMVFALCISTGAYADEDRVLHIEAVFTSEWFNPLTYGNGDKVVYHALFDTLTRFDNDGNVIPNLAESWEKEGDKVTFHLREAYFTSGNKVTANDVVFSYNVILEDPTLSFNMTAWSAGCEAVDENTVVFTLANSFCKYENFLAELLYVIEEASYDRDADWSTTAPVGSGAYTFGGQDAARTVTLNANENYWNGAPAVKTVEVVANMDDATALIALQTGELDVATQTGLAAYTQTASMNGVEGVSFNGWQGTGLMDMSGDVYFREAVFHAISRDTLIAICLNGNGVPSTNMFAAKISDPYTNAIDFTGYDVDMALEALSKSETDLSQTFAIEVFDADSAAAAQCIQADLAAIGINVEVVEEEIGIWFGNLMDGTMQMSVVAMGTDMVGVEDMLSMFDPVAGYPFPISDELLEMIQTAPYIQDDAERYDEVIKTMEMVFAEGVWVPLYDAPMYYAYSSNVQGLIDASAATCVFYVGDMSFAA